MAPPLPRWVLGHLAQGIGFREQASEFVVLERKAIAVRQEQADHVAMFVDGVVFATWRLHDVSALFTMRLISVGRPNDVAQVQSDAAEEPRTSTIRLTIELSFHLIIGRTQYTLYEI